MTTFFGFAVADGMFPENCIVTRKSLTVEEVRGKLPTAKMCLNPSHKATIETAIKKFGLAITVPEKAPVINLKVDDTIIVMSVRGLPRREGRHEYTDEEIEKATFEFGEWSVAGVGYRVQVEQYMSDYFVEASSREDAEAKAKALPARDGSIFREVAYLVDYPPRPNG